jgi:hypothetical protein
MLYRRSGKHAEGFVRMVCGEDLQRIAATNAQQNY